ncbi:hypothetical protein [Virgibacillus halodenitrificans]|uniref:hypothetical protein n=1 Tax=Virgibacillus halodenitrificans TaxID=1482 RepID=UPI000EF525E8|nr:hypothetical protein [Virgibacillus halodenitrificans]
MVVAVNLINGSSNVRDSFVNKTEVLDKVKELVLLPDNKFMTLRQVADYYESDLEVVRKTLQRHRGELESDGMIKLKGKSLTEYKQTLPYSVSELRKVPSTQLLPRRAILRMGMLLKNSKVAIKVRTYLLEAERMVTKNQKKLTFQGSWTEEIDNYIIDVVSSNESKGIRLNDSMQQIADNIHASVYQIKNYWYVGGQGKEPLRTRVKHDIQETTTHRVKKCTYDLFTVAQDEEEITEKLLLEQINLNKQLFSEVQSLKETNHQMMSYMKCLHSAVMNNIAKEERALQEHEQLKLMVRELHNIADLKNQEETEQLLKKNKRLVKKLKIAEKEYEELKVDMNELIRRAGVSVLLGETSRNDFRMDQNGNLEWFKK